MKRICSIVPAVAKHRNSIARGGARLPGFSIDSALFSALWATVVLLHPLLDCALAENMAACGDASIFAGDIIE